MSDRVFLDANVVFSAAYSRTSELRQLWFLDGVTLLTSAYAAAEARRNLPAARVSDLESLLEAVTVVPTPTAEDLLLPPGLLIPAKDAPIFRAAAAAKATHLLTGDKRHSGPYYDRQFAGVRILPPRAYPKSCP